MKIERAYTDERGRLRRVRITPRTLAESKVLASVIESASFTGVDRKFGYADYLRMLSTALIRWNMSKRYETNPGQPPAFEMAFAPFMLMRKELSALMTKAEQDPTWLEDDEADALVGIVHMMGL